MSWKEDQAWEAKWWSTCQNTFGEEQKQLEYAPKMGLQVIWDAQGPHIDCQGKTILDVGGGPVSLLLKCINLKKGVVIDPLSYPKWTIDRYKTAGIDFKALPGEEIPLDTVYDEVWAYNLLQHVIDPAEIVRRMRKVSKIIRVFDWLEIGVAKGHPHNLTEEKMNEWYGGEGKVEKARIGYSYSGIFLGDHYK